MILLYAPLPNSDTETGVGFFVFLCLKILYLKKASYVFSKLLLPKPIIRLSVIPFSRAKRILDWSNPYNSSIPKLILPKRCDIINSKTPFLRFSIECPLSILVPLKVEVT